MDAISYILSKNRNDYQRDNFDDFLSHIKFSFNIPAIHVAGTNGKGSTSTFIKDVYTANGYKVGIFNSPDELTKMIKIGDFCIDNRYIESIVNEYKKLFEKCDLSTFEIETFIAFKYFMDQKVDLAVIECGMGGEYDATNIFTPILSIITSISIEHSDFLGQSLSEIAEHKAGIIKDYVPALISDIQGDALDIIVKRCKEEGSELTILDHFHNVKNTTGFVTFDYRPYNGLMIKTPAIYRVKAACLAIEATNILKEQFPVEEEKLKEGLLKSKLNCRFEIVNNNPYIILDGAHNPEGMEQLRKDIDHLPIPRPIHVVFAAFRDKNIAQMLPEISLIGKVTLTTFDNPRARLEDDYFLYLEDYQFVEDYKALIDQLLLEYPEDSILITGSLAFTYKVREYLESKGLIKNA